jgi:hypothetical protein
MRGKIAQKRVSTAFILVIAMGASVPCLGADPFLAERDAPSSPGCEMTDFDQEDDGYLGDDVGFTAVFTGT